MMLFRIGWWVLVVSTGLFALNHLAGTAAFATSDDERMMFLVFAALQLLALIVLLVPYRARERWAWWAIWIPIAAMLVTPLVFGIDTIGLMYVISGVVMAVAHLLAAPQVLKEQAQAQPT